MSGSDQMTLHDLSLSTDLLAYVITSHNASNSLSIYLTSLPRLRRTRWNADVKTVRLFSEAFCGFGLQAESP